MGRLAITLQLEPAAQDRFDAERARLPSGTGEACIELFRAVPDEIEERVRIDLVDVAGPAFPIGVAAVLPLESGVAYALVSPELQARRQALANLWWQHLEPIDRARFRPHVTLVSGIEPVAARAAVNVLRHSFRAYETRADGFVLWRVGDPWTELATIPFA